MIKELFQPGTNIGNTITELVSVDYQFKTVDRISELYTEMMRLKKSGSSNYLIYVNELTNLFAEIGNASLPGIDSLRRKFKRHFNLFF